jgi:PBP1b-binding outer membrane lipoprotein LpoB
MRVLVLIGALLLTGCNREPSFDERYAKAEKTIREKAAEMDAELAERERLASEAAGENAGRNTPATVK